MFNFQMDNILSLHGLIGESKTEGITPLGKFKTKPYTSIPLEVVQNNIDADKSNMAINNKGVILYEHNDQKVYWKTFGSSQLVMRHEVTDLDWSLTYVNFILQLKVLLAYIRIIHLQKHWLGILL
ncbi:hypothetical protein C1146_12945 [Clostridium botulinum]|nr:hypothetical protein C1146_12945 [Clostridium botulinum]